MDVQWYSALGYNKIKPNVMKYFPFVTAKAMTLGFMDSGNQ